MANKKGVETHIEVPKGFVTEVNPIVGSPEVLLDIANCIISPDGTIRRRLGVELENGYVTNLVNNKVLETTELTAYAFTTHTWESVANLGTLNIVVQQVGSILQFFEQTGALSDTLLGERDLADYAVDSAQVSHWPVQMVNGLGKLFVVGKYIRPLEITYEEGNFIISAITIRIRDLQGLEETEVVPLAEDDRPETLTSQHYYNLINQGWTNTNIGIFVGSTGTTPENGDTIMCTFITDELVRSPGFPTNHDTMLTGIVTNSSGNLVFDPEFVRNNFEGNTPTTKGHFILDAFAQYRKIALGNPCPAITLENTIITTRPQAIAFHQGRVFYSSPVHANQANGIFYSQALLTDNRAGNCFQEADPTAEEVNDLVATDGGWLPTPGVGEVYRMQEIANGIAVFASNGIWFITGADNSSAMTATNIRLDKLYASGVFSASSIVEAEGGLYFFGIEGIMRIVMSETGPIVENISKSSIQTFYTGISATSRERAAAIFVPADRKIFWAYSSSSVVAPNLDSFLILDLNIGGYYKYNIQYDGAQTTPQIIGVSRVAALALGLTSDVLLELNGDVVTELDGVTPITIDVAVNASQTSELKLATIVNDTAKGGNVFTFSAFDRGNFRDWTATTPNKMGLPMVSSIDFAQTAMEAVHTKGNAQWVHTYYSKDTKNKDLAVVRELEPIGTMACAVGLSVVVLIDISNSMLSSGFLTSDIKPSIKSMISDMLISMEGVAIAVDGFSDDTKHFQGFTTDETALHNAVDAAYDDAIAGNSTNLGAGIDAAVVTTTGAFGISAILVITDGIPNIPEGEGMAAGDAAATVAELSTEIYVAGIGGRDGYNDLYLETFIATTPTYFSQIDDYDEMLVELAKIAVCPYALPAPEDYASNTYATHWKTTQGSFDVADSRVEWIEQLSMYIMLSEATIYGATDAANIHTSPDGITWTPRDNALATTSLWGVAYAPSLGLAVAVGDQNTGAGATSGIRTSSNGTVWTPVVAPVDDFYYDIAWSPSEAIFVAVGGNGIISSTDGAVWTVRSSVSGLRTIAYSASLDKFVAITMGRDALISTDGITWVTHTDVLPLGAWWDVAWSPTNDRFVAVSISNSSADGIAYSADGITWNVATAAGDMAKGRWSVKWIEAEGKFISVDDDNDSNIISSADGITWAEETALTDWPAVNTELHDIAYKSATEWVLIRRIGTIVYHSISAPF